MTTHQLARDLLAGPDEPVRDPSRLLAIVAKYRAFAECHHKLSGSYRLGWDVTMDDLARLRRDTWRLRDEAMAADALTTTGADPR